MSKEIIIPHNEIKDSKTITGIMENKFKEHGLDLHVNEVESLDDDHHKGIRRLQVKNSKYFIVRVPWKE